MLEICLIGAGRIAQIHAANVARHPHAHLRYVVDVQRAAAEALATTYGAQSETDVGRALADPKVNAVIIASPTATHVDLIIAAAQAGKAVFCEKPIDLHMHQVDRCIARLKITPVPFFIAFNRRFDPSFARVQQQVRDGAIGRVELINITSRDPSPPPIGYIANSGGLFRDMMIHDFDMSRWLAGEEWVEVFARGSCVVDPAIGSAGDVDTAMVMLRSASGVLCHIDNSRRAIYGYDQRIEVFGSQGMLQAANRSSTSTQLWSSTGIISERPMAFFLDRYAEAYALELDHFVRSVLDGTPLRIGAHDGRQALVLADAALRSATEGQPVTLTL